MASISDEEYEAELRLRAARRAQAIVKREGAALALSARELNEGPSSLIARFLPLQSHKPSLMPSTETLRA